MQPVHDGLNGSVDRLHLLEVFLAVAETKSVTAGARRLGLSQSTVTRMIQRLEALAKVTLVQRTSRGVVLTREGEQMTRMAPVVLESWSSALQYGHEDRIQLSGTLKVIAPVALGQRSLALILARFLKQHPSLSIELELRDDPIDLRTEKYDLWLRVGSTPDDLVVQNIYRVKRVLVASPTYPRIEHPRQLASARALRLRPFTPQIVRLTHSAGEVYKLSQKCALLSENVETVRLATLEGTGYAVLPLWAVKRDLVDHKLHRLCPAWDPPSLKVSLAFLPNPARPARVNELIKFIREEFKNPQGTAMTYLREQDITDTVELL